MSTVKVRFFRLATHPRGGNAHADSLAMLAISSAQNLPRVILVEDLCKPTETSRGTTRIHHIRAGPSWMDSIMQFLKEDTLLEERIEADKVRKRPQGTGYSRTRGYTNVLFQDLICYVFILR